MVVKIKEGCETIEDVYKDSHGEEIKNFKYLGVVEEFIRREDSEIKHERNQNQNHCETSQNEYPDLGLEYFTLCELAELAEFGEPAELEE
jgi:hypothetical protein